MAARRLILLMVVLFMASALAAALAPEPREGGETTTEGTVTTPPPETEPGGLVERTLDADADRPQTIELREGDQLALLVRSQSAGEVQIPALGLLDHVDPDAPARFDLLAERPGSLNVLLLEPRRRIGTIEVRAREPQPEPLEAAEAEAQA